MLVGIGGDTLGKRGSLIGFLLLGAERAVIQVLRELTFTLEASKIDHGGLIRGLY